MSCLSANAKLVSDKVDIGASLERGDVSVDAVVIGDDLEASARLIQEEKDLSAELRREDLHAIAEVKRDKIEIGLAIICSIGKDNSLWASDGVLYDGYSDPLFVTE